MPKFGIEPNMLFNISCSYFDIMKTVLFGSWQREEIILTILLETFLLS